MKPVPAGGDHDNSTLTRRRMMSHIGGLHKDDPRFTAMVVHLARPEAGLDLTNVCFSQEIHAKP